MGLAGTPALSIGGLACLDDGTRADATGTDFHGLNCSVVDRFNFLQVRVPSSTRLVVCVANVVTGAWTFTTDFAFSGHVCLPPC